MSNRTWGLLIAGSVVFAANAPWIYQLIRYLWKTRTRKSDGHPAFFASRHIH